MALVLKDRVKETTTTTGTGTITLAGAATGFQSFSVIGNANTTYYTIAGQSGSEWEVGIGTYTTAGTLLSRDTILESSNGGTAVNFSAGTKDVFVTYPAERAVYADGAVLTATNSAVLPTASGGTGQSSYAVGDLLYASTTTALSKLADVATGNALISGGVSTAPSWGKIGLSTHVSGTLPTANGGTGATTANAAMANLMGFTSTVTAAGTTTLTNTSSYYQLFTGPTTQTVVLPVTSTLQTGWTFHICNNSTGTVTVQSSGLNTVISVLAGITAMCTCIGTTLTTASDWEAGYTDFSTVTGTGGSVVLSSSASLTTPTLTSPLASGTLDFTGTAALASNFHTVQTSGVMTIGGGLGTGGITVGRSTVSQTTSIQAGATASGSTKTINFGSGGLAGSTTAITIGSTTGTSTTTLNGTTTLANALAATSGGTGQSSYAVGDLLYASTTTALSKLADVATGNALISGGVGVNPSWGKVGLTTHISGTLPVANGGTNASSASITAFNNITGYSASGATGTTSTNLVFSTSPTLTTPKTTTTIGVGNATPSTSGAGITFPATQSASANANTLDDYEEGTWTPSLGGTATYDIRTGTYTKIGNVVTITGSIRPSFLGTGSTNTLTGLPFSNAGDSAGGIGYGDGFAVSVYSVYLYVTGTSLITYGYTAAAANTPVVNLFQTSARIYFSATYLTS